MARKSSKRGNAKGTVYLLDVSFFTFRAYYALPPLNTSEGLATNAVHGVATMLERLIRTEEPHYIAACFDTAGDTFRNELYADYKANRDEPDEDLRVQFPYVRRLIEAMSIHCVEKPGFEADDLLATLARRFGDDGYDIVIVTGDKDMMQCVNDRVSLYDPVKNVRVREPEVEAKFGVAPSAVTDVQGLMGDATDNIPGIRGVGPKTATALIQHFGSIENMLARSEEIESLGLRGAAGIRKKVEAGREAAELSKQLATIREDVPVEVTDDDVAFESLHTVELASLAEELEMRTFASRVRTILGGDGGADADGSPDTSASDVDDAAGTKTRTKAAGNATGSKSAAFADDWREFAGGETVFLLTDDEFGAPVMALVQGKRRALVEGAGDVAAAVAHLVEAGASLCGYDVKELCRRYGAAPGDDAFDVGVASYLYDPSVGEHGSAEIADRFLGEALSESGATAETLGPAIDQLSRVIPVVREALDEHDQGELYRTIELPLVSILGRIEARGILLDVELLGQLSRDFTRRMDGLVGKVYAAAGEEFNILSPAQLRVVLFEHLGLPTKGVKKTKTGLSTDTDTLHALAEHHELPGLILEYRGLAKLKSTYVDALPRLVDEKNRVHTRLNQTVTATGRLSSKDPNLQNIPIRTDDGARIREAFIAGAGNKLVSADYNQIELRVLAHLSSDETLIASFRDGLDIHSATASEVFEVAKEDVTPDMRRASKVINYGIIYGMGPVRMSRELGIPRARAAEYIERYFDRYPGVQKFYGEMLELARELGYVSTLLGRRRYLPDVQSENGGLRQAAERVATNTPIQGSAADIIKLAMVRLSDRLSRDGLETVMVLQIHDELLLECPESETDQALALVRESMENAVELAVPVVADVGVGVSWAEAH